MSMPAHPRTREIRSGVAKGPGVDLALRQELLGLDDLASSRFIEIGRRLRKFSESIPAGHKIKTIRELLKGSKVSYRSADCWMRIDRIYSRYKVQEDRLARIGWSKLMLMARHVNSRTLEEWLAFSECHTADEVRARIRNTDPSSHHVVFKLSQLEHSILTATLIANGARPIGRRRLFDKEAALMKLCRRAMDAKAKRARVETEALEDDETSWHMSR